MKVLVTGAPGTGKTALVEYALKQGDKNYFDLDEIDGLCEWREYATGKVIGSVATIQPHGDVFASTTTSTNMNNNAEFAYVGQHQKITDIKLLWTLWTPRTNL